MSRLDQQPEDALAQAILMAHNSLNELKSRQFVGGSNFLTNHTETGNTWDVVSASMTAFQTSTWLVKFTPTIAKSVFAILELVSSFTGATGFETIDYYPDPANVTADTYRSWIVAVNADSNTIGVNLRFSILSVGGGVTSWVRTS